MNNRIFLPDMRNKIEKYVIELDQAIDQCYDDIKSTSDLWEQSKLEAKMNTLMQVKYELHGLLEETI